MEAPRLGPKIMIIGCSGSGKTTLALQLQRLTGLPVVHLDKEYWRAGWVATPREEWRAKQKALISGERWIADGNYQSSLDIRIGRADTILFLDCKRRVCLFRVVKRWWTHLGRTRADMAQGCRERLDAGLLRFVWRFPKEGRPEILKRLQQTSGKQLVVLRNTREVRRFLQGISG